MREDSQSTYVLQRTFSDVDDLAAEAKQWSLDFRQLERGKFHGEILQFGAWGVHISDARFARSLNQKGLPPPAMRTIAVPANPHVRLMWRGRVIDGQSLMVFPRGAELSSVSDANFHVYTCSFPEGLLSSCGEVMQVGDMDSGRGGADAVRVEETAIKTIRNCLFRICQSVRNHPTVLPATRHDQLTRQLPSHIISALAGKTASCPSATTPRRLAALKRAETHVERHAHEDLRVRDLCYAAGVSERTLEYAFQQRFGIGPGEYVRNFRFSSVRRALRAADPKTTKVADVANAWGFWHMGQFAADYRQRYEELPSSTLHRSPTT